MNFYKRYIGDYQRDTQHLSLVEHGAYALMLDSVYATEQPLPLDHQKLYRICRAVTSDEQAAVDFVVDRFWRKTGGGYVNTRALEEVASAQERIESARKNGSKGGRPKTETKPSRLAKGKPKQNPAGNPPGNPLGCPAGNPERNRIKSSPDPDPDPDLSSPRRRRKGSLSAQELDGEFEKVWLVLPKRKGTNPKKAAKKAWEARVNEGEDISVLHEGAKRYRGYCDEEKMTGTRYVLRGSTFFGPDKHYLEKFDAGDDQSWLDELIPKSS